jgi:hypothetical protein
MSVSSVAQPELELILTPNRLRALIEAGSGSARVAPPNID